MPVLLRDQPPACRTTEALRASCFHCGTPCSNEGYHREGKLFCCAGCVAVFDLLVSSGLDKYYRLADMAGLRIRSNDHGTRFRFVDAPPVRSRLIDFSDERVTRVTFYIPAIHCIACVWLLENLFRQ